MTSFDDLNLTETQRRLLKENATRTIHAPAKPSWVIVDDSPYIRAHGKSPRGYGFWAFGPEKNTDCLLAKFFPGTFTEAKRAAKQWAAGMGFSVIYVQS